MKLALVCALALQTAQAPSLERWRELAELELYAELLDERAAAEPGGVLAAEGEAAALVARALFETRGPEGARAWLDQAEPRASPATAPLVALERVRGWIEDDELERALAALAGARKPLRLRSRPSGRRAGSTSAASTPAAASSSAPARPSSASWHWPHGTPKPPAAHYTLSQEALRRGDGAAARAHAERAAQLGEWLAYLNVRRLQVRETPGEPLPRLGLALAWMHGGELGRAEGVLRELLARFPEHATAWFHLGEVLRMRSDFAGARAAYDRAVALDESELLARYNRAVLARLEGRAADARADFAWLAEGPHADDPRLLGAHLELARLLLAAGEGAAAEARYAEYRARGGREPLGP